MAALKGHAFYGGSRKGIPNKVTASVRETFSTVFNLLQQDEKANLLTWGKENATEFYKISSKLIPMDISLQGRLNLTVVTGVPGSDDDLGEDLI